MREPTIREIAESQAFNELFNRLENSLKDRMAQNPLSDDEGLKLYRLMYHAVGELERFIRSEVQAVEIDGNGETAPSTRRP